MCAALAQRGVQVSLFTTNLDGRGDWMPFKPPAVLDVPTQASETVQGVERTWFPIRGRPSRFIFTPAMARELRRQVSEFDVVHAHSIHAFTTLAAGHYARSAGVPYVIQPHGALDPVHRLHHKVVKDLYDMIVERRNMDRASAIIYTTEEEKRQHNFKTRAAVIPYALSRDDYLPLPQRGAFRRRHPAIGNSLLIVFLSRLSPKKGLDLLIPAFARVVAQSPNVHLVVAGPGEGDMEHQVRTWITQHGIGDKVTLTGMLLGQDKLELLADGDIFVLPSYGESFGIAVTEAMLCGMPVVVSDQVSIQRVISETGSGMVVSCTADSLASAMLRLAEDPELRSAQGVAGRRAVLARFAWPQVVADLERLYRSIAEVHRSGTRPKPSR